MITAYKFEGTLSLFAFALLFIFQAANSFASPPACDRKDVDKFLFADSVVEAKVIKSRRWKEGFMTLHLVGKYQVLKVFKGDVKKDSVQIVTHTCLDKQDPLDRLGYPSSVQYCPGGAGLHLTGVNAKSGHLEKKGKEAPHWILFLKKDSRVGAPQLTWKEVPSTSFVGGCRRGEKEIPKELQEGFRRMMERKKTLELFLESPHRR